MLRACTCFGGLVTLAQCLGAGAGARSKPAQTSIAGGDKGGTMEQPMMKKGNRPGVITVFFVLCLLYFVVWYLWRHESIRLFSEYKDPNELAAFGATSALFTGLAVVISAFTAALQFQSLTEAKVEMAEQRKMLDSQLKTLEVQSFESSFFSILEMHRDYTDSCNGIWYVEKYIAGIHANVGRILEAYNVASDRIEEGEAGKLINLCCVVLRYVDGAKFLEIQEKQFYIDIFKTRISEGECTLLAMHFVGKNGDPKMRTLVEAFALFSIHRLVAVPEEIKSIYSPRAFGNSP